MRVFALAVIVLLCVSCVSCVSIHRRGRYGHGGYHHSYHFIQVAGPTQDKQQTFLNQVLGDIKACGGGIISNGACAVKFKQYTGVDQAGLLKLWENPNTKSFTTCNGFTGVYLFAMGFPGLGRFDLDKFSQTKQFVYVPSQKGTLRLPAYGDVCFGPNFHVWVSLGEQGVVEGGQGGPKAGWDKVDFKDYSLPTITKKDITKVKWCLDVTALMDSRTTL